MTESTQPTDPIVPPATGEPGPPEPTKPAKKTAAKKVAAKKVAAKKVAAPAPEKATNPPGVYLPTLPEGFVVTAIEISGPGGEMIAVGPSTSGGYTLTAEGAGMKRESEFPSLKEAAARAGKAAKGMDQIHKREKAAAEAREKAFDF